MDNSVVEFSADRASGPNPAVLGFASERTSVTQRPVLVAIDLSEDSHEAVLWACDYARQASAPLHIVHCLHDPAEAPGRYAHDRADPLERMADTAQRLLSHFVDGLRQAYPGHETLAVASARLVAGLPVRAILDEAAALDAGLIVLGSRGKNGLKRALFGSVAQQVTQLSTVPVTLVKAQQ